MKHKPYKLIKRDKSVICITKYIPSPATKIGITQQIKEIKTSYANLMLSHCPAFPISIAIKSFIGMNKSTSQNIIFPNTKATEWQQVSTK